MSAPRPDHLAESYPPPLEAAERAAVDQRRRANDLPLNAPLVGVALSGGGIRSATFCIGLFQALARQRLVRRIDFLSTVSGGGYFGSFLGAAFARSRASADTVEDELADDHSWSLQWLRDNGRFLSPNGAGDSWLAAAVFFRNWVALHVVLLTFAFLLLGFGVLVRAELWSSIPTRALWSRLEILLWEHPVLGLWWSPWLLLPAVPFVLVMVPAGATYWLTQLNPLMALVRQGAALGSARARECTTREFASLVQNGLTHVFGAGFMATIVLLIFAIIDSLGQTAYFNWAADDFAFPSLWALLTGAGVGAYGFGAKLFMLLESALGKRKIKIATSLVALVCALAWSLLIVVGLSVAACGFGWDWQPVWDGSRLAPMADVWKLMLAVAVAFALSWWFSRSFSFVNLSSMQQLYAARLRRAYIGATNPHRRRQENYSMTDLVPGDDFSLEDYRPHENGGPLHLINVTVNETLSAKTQIERLDRKGLTMAVGPCGLSVGTTSHALWTKDPTGTSRPSPLRALWENITRPIEPVGCGHSPHALQTTRRSKPVQKIEALSLGRWTSISGAAFTTGSGAGTAVGLSLLLGLANVRLGYWWDCGIEPHRRPQTSPPTFFELAGRVASWVLPLQTCLVNEFLARFHGPARRHWYLSDGGHFENTGCYELIRRRVPLIICSDAGQDPAYQFADFANLIRKARTDFGAEIEVIRRSAQRGREEPATGQPLPSLEDLVHPSLLEAIGPPEDFCPPPGTQDPDDDDSGARPPAGARRHALLARIRYFDTGEICWLLVLKPSLKGDESVDVTQYQRTHPLFPQEPTSDQYFDEAQWESYRKLGDHIGTTLFASPANPSAGWSPSEFRAPSARMPSLPAGRDSNDVPAVPEPAGRLSGVG
ncbi:MAG TPA: hypothetical protein VFC28_13975 [Opitutaceae bacterium]|nr:hypothetical protein [Opitutaceae bacterium]